ncbi:MAG: hypothetical protein J6N52_01950 [Clostridia bacterium]|nr:hypothetical protein [Clostridia bacterium]
MTADEIKSEAEKFAECRIGLREYTYPEGVTQSEHAHITQLATVYLDKAQGVISDEEFEGSVSEICGRFEEAKRVENPVLTKGLMKKYALEICDNWLNTGDFATSTIRYPCRTLEEYKLVGLLAQAYIDVKKHEITREKGAEIQRGLFRDLDELHEKMRYRY